MALFRYGLSAEAKQLLAACPNAPQSWRMMAYIITENSAVVQSMDKTVVRRKSTSLGRPQVGLKERSPRDSNGK
ncbi:HFR030Cp [Eremothecium sinecaudum]|uniref:HFR030Cp n=1 Tax=Eremothecium sinecaudum TaxID=45286 RepID=A0A109UZS7_9SACH|nr:HFR030Cp [Eremothecium sinecaudum]AMD21885.1 HFR030Cp [Eremothecium sinecaudum]